MGGSWRFAGVLVQRLVNDPQLVGVTHVIMDEVHERSLESDFLITLLKVGVGRWGEGIGKRGLGVWGSLEGDFLKMLLKVWGGG